jgi:acyl-CoA hydrolase
MNWKEDYRRKVSKLTEAIKDIHDGQCVVNDRMISINSCLEVDLQGQVASETIWND